MCDFIALIVPNDADESALASLVDRRKLGRGLSRWSGGEAVILNVEPRAKCHCGTALGSLEQPAQHEVRDREVDRKRRAGWSEARISRWIDQREASERRKESEHARHVASLGQDDAVHGWFPFVHEALTSGATRELGLVVTEGEYSGHPDGVVTVRLAELSPSVLRTMHKGVVYTIVS